MTTQNMTAQNMTAQPMSQEQFERLENEWRLMRESASAATKLQGAKSGK